MFFISILEAMNNNIWITALSQWKAKKMGDTGCTLPFLAGMTKELSPPTDPTADDIKEILTYLLNNSSKDKFRIGFCPKLKYPIIEKSASNGGDLEYTEGEWRTPNLFVDEKIVERYAGTTENIVAGLLKDNTLHIENKHYSLSSNGAWGDYTELEKTFIKTVLQFV